MKGAIGCVQGAPAARPRAPRRAASVVVDAGVDEVMRADLASVPTNALALPINASIVQAAALMSYEGVETIVITDLNGQVAGVVQAIDIVRWLARRAGYLVDRMDGDGDLAA